MTEKGNVNKDRTIEIQYYDWRLIAWLTSETRDRLSASGRGIYRELLDQCYAQGSFPDDQEWICRKCAATPEELSAAWPIIERHFPKLPKKKTHRHNSISDMFRKNVIGFLNSAKTSGKKGGIKSQEIKRLSRVPSQSLEGSLELTNVTNERNEVNEHNEHTEPSVRAAMPTLRKPTVTDLNGLTSQRFDEFWGRYPRQQHRDAACHQWLSVVTIEVEPAVFGCLQRYLDSDEVARGAVANPEKWLLEQHRDGWAGNWPAARLSAPQRQQTAMEQALAMAKARTNGTK